MQKKHNKRRSIRIIHNMARSGGTLISRCLGSMNGVLLLSEIHPAAGGSDTGPQYDPLVQAHLWHELLRTEDVKQVSNHVGGPGFADAIELVWKRCEESGRALVLRDWSHLDYTAVPFPIVPEHRMALVEMLSGRFNVIHTMTVRHPVDQWLSFSKLPVVKGKIDFATFMRGYRLFLEHYRHTGIIRYEDFTSHPDQYMRLLCERLELAYDPGYKKKWQYYHKVTGDGAGARRVGDSIRHLPGKPVPESLLAKTEQNSDYQQVIALLGYDQA